MKGPREALGVKAGPNEIVVLPDGSFSFGSEKGFFLSGTSPVQFGEGNCSKRLYGGYLPIVVATQERDGFRFEETALGWSRGLSPDKPLFAIVRFSVFNRGRAGRKLDVQWAAPKPVARWGLDIPPGASRAVCLQIPFAKPNSATRIGAAVFRQRLTATAAAWRALLSAGIRIRVPEERVNDAYRAWLADNFIDVDKRGKVYEPHDGAGFYEEVYGYSASRYCYALDLMGYPREAQRYLDSILTFVSPDGLLVKNYGLPDTGAQLWAMARHFQITRDATWLRRVSPTMIKMCHWIIRTRHSSMEHQSPDDLWYGLIKYRPYCDETTPAYSYLSDTYLALGLQSAAAALRAVGLSEPARRIAGEGAAYKRDILNSMKRAAFEHDGIKMLPMFPQTRALLKRVGYTGADYYSLVSSMVLETGMLPPNGASAELITNLLRKRGGLCLGVCRFRDGIDHAYTYGYWMTCLERDEVKRAILGFYTSLAYGMSRNTYSSVEVTRLRTGDNAPTLPHLYSGTQQLLLLRNMLLREDGNALWIGQAIPRPWLAGGKTVSVQKAPTLFGVCGFSIRSFNGARRMSVQLDPPRDRPPERIYLRLRQPRGLPIRSVILNGAALNSFKGETITLPRLNGPATIQVGFSGKADK